jgi:hypothetical protein
MPGTLEELQSAVANALPYLEHEHLIIPYFDTVIQPHLQAALEEIVPSIEAHHVINTTDGKSTVSCIHYTSMSRLVSMLGSHSDIEKAYLRLYDSVHLNDPDEGIYLLRNLNRSGNYDWIRLDPAPTLTAYDRNVAYVMSFVVPKDDDHVDDNLVFWRTYGHEGKGCSLSLVIEPEHLKRVLYGNDIDRTVALIEPVLEAMSPLFDSAPQDEPTLQEKTINTIVTALRGILYLYKSNAYKYENEARIVLLDSDVEDGEIRYDYQSSSSGLPRIRHYVEFEKISLKQLLRTGSRITVGPTVPHAENVYKYLEKMKKKLGLRGTNVQISQIPYRLP